MSEQKIIDRDSRLSLRLPILLAAGWVFVVAGLFVMETAPLYHFSSKWAKLFIENGPVSDSTMGQTLQQAYETVRIGRERAILLAVISHITAIALGLAMIYVWAGGVRKRERERDQAIAALRRSESMFRGVAEASPFGLAVIGPDRALEYLNPKFTQIFGYTLKDVPDDFRRLQEQLPQETDPVDGTARPKPRSVMRKDGARRMIVFRTADLDGSRTVVTYQDVTELWNIQEALTRANVEWERTFNAVADLIAVVDVNRRILRVNKALADSLNAGPDDLPGLPCYEVLEGIPQPPQNCPLTKLLLDGKAHHSTQMLHRLNKIYSVTVNPVHGTEGELLGAVHIARDITEQRQAEEELLRQNEFLKTILESLTYPFYVIDARSHNIVMANSAAGVPSDKKSLTCYGHIHHVDEPCSKHDPDCPLEKVIRSKEPYTKEDLLFDENGEMRTVEIHAYPIMDSNGEVSQIIQYMLDVTDRRKTEDLLLRTERLRGIGELATGVAHNFNNLLQMVMGSAQVGLNKIASDDLESAKRHFTRILESAKFGADTVRRLQDFANVRTDDPQETIAVFDVSETVSNAAEMSRLWWRSNLEPSGAEIELKLDLTPGCMIIGKESEIFEVVVNLVKNAAEALSQRGVVIVSTKKHEDHIIMRVEDNGPGIPKEFLDKVFDPFWTTKGLKGSGMGLSATYGIVARYGGVVKAENRPDGGAAFTVHLPAASQDYETSRPSRPSSLDLRINILVVDDTEDVVSLLKDGLESYGQTVFAAHSGEEALEIYDESHVDLVICDLGMPGLTGWDVGRAVRKRCEEKGIPKTPFMLLTGWGGQIGERNRIAESGVDLILEKPLDINRLVEIIKEIRETDKGRNGAVPD